jgi:polyphosphate kinase
VKKQKRSRFLAWAVFNRDLSQLEFFRRLLEEAIDKSVPLLEKLKFLSVFADNLDEFFMVRVSGLKEMLEIENLGPMPGELTPAEQLKVIRQRVLPLVEEHTRCLREEVIPGLKKAGVVIAPYDSLSKSEKRRLAQYFKKNVFLILTPQAVDPSHPFPYMSNLSLNIGLTVEHDRTGEDPDDEATVRFVRIKVPPLTPRLVPVSEGGLKFTLLEELIEANMRACVSARAICFGSPVTLT